MEESLIGSCKLHNLSVPGRGEKKTIPFSSGFATDNLWMCVFTFVLDSEVSWVMTHHEVKFLLSLSPTTLNSTTLNPHEPYTRLSHSFFFPDRTGILRRDGYPSRHLGPIQMTTDTALGVTKLIAQDGKSIEEIKFVDHPTIKFPGKGYENESVEMPFRYVVDEKTGEPILPEGMREHLR